MLDATPSIELKTRIGARKKPKKQQKKKQNKTKTTKKQNKTNKKTDTFQFQKPLESLSGNSFTHFSLRLS